jgi:hypothetical protein
MPPIQWVPGTLSLDVKRPGSEYDHSPQSSAEVNMTSRRDAQLKHRDDFTFDILLCFMDIKFQ